MCETCNGGDNQKPMKLCQDCHTVIHSLGKAFMAHKVIECVAYSMGGESSLSREESMNEQKMLLTKLVKLEQCPRHQEPIEYYLDEELDEDSTFELSGVTYGCQRCIANSDTSMQASFTKIDKDNLLNVFQLKQELFKER